MRDCTADIIISLKGLLGNLSSAGTKFDVEDTLPEAKAFKHVWIKGISSISEGTKDKNIQRITIDLEVVHGGMAQKGSLTLINDISDQICQVIGMLSLFNFFIVIPPELLRYSYTEERGQHDNQTIIINRKILSFETTIQERWT